MDGNLKQKTISALIWSAIERFGVHGVQFILGLLLARILAPKDYGLLGMLAIFIAVAQSFIDSGFKSALIQKKDADNIDFSTVFYFNIFVSACFYLLFVFLAKYIAAFYMQPELVLLTKVVSINFIINSFGLIQVTLLTKKIDFKTQAKINLISIILSGSLGLFLAFKGYGVWALVFQSISRNTISTFSLWYLSKWRPLLVFSKKSFKSLFAFGSRLLISGLFNTVFNNVYFIVIGKLFSAQLLGYYTRAEHFQRLSATSFNSIIQGVTFPVFSSIQDCDDRLKSGFKKALKMTVFVNFPLMFGLILISEPFIKIVLTEKWLPSVPYLQVLCLAGLLFPIHALNLNMLNVKGRSDLFLKLEILKKILIVVIIAITYRWGIIAMIWGQVAHSFISFFLNSYYSGVLVKYNYKEQLKDVVPFFFLSLLMFVTTYSLTYFILNDIVKLLAQIVIGVSSYYLFCQVFKIKEFYEGMKIVRSFSQKFG